MEKRVDNIPLADHNYEEVLERSFTDVPNTSFKPTVKKEVIVDIDFAEKSRNFWTSHESGMYLPTYNEGVLNGTFNDRQVSFASTTDTILEALRNIIRIEAEKDGKTLEEFSEYIANLRQAFKLLSDKIDSTLDDGMDGQSLMAYLHSTINAFINTNITTKD